MAASCSPLPTSRAGNSNPTSDMTKIKQRRLGTIHKFGLLPFNTASADTMDTHPPVAFSLLIETVQFTQQVALKTAGGLLMHLEMSSIPKKSAGAAFQSEIVAKRGSGTDQEHQSCLLICCLKSINLGDCVWWNMQSFSSCTGYTVAHTNSELGIENIAG